MPKVYACVMSTHSHMPLRVTLLIIAGVLLSMAWFCMAYPSFFTRFYQVTAFPDSAHSHLLIILGTLLLVYAAGAIFAAMRPVRNNGIVLLLIVLHFALFVVDIVLLARGAALPLRYVLPEMLYVLLMCTLLIRYYPVRDHGEELRETADVLVQTFQDRLRKDRKDEEKTKRNAEPEKAEPETTQ